MAEPTPIAGLATARALRNLRVPDDAIRRALRAEVGLAEAQIVRVFAALEGRIAPAPPAPEAPTAARLGLPVCPGCPGVDGCRCIP
jgi:hypothetical protein